MKDYFDNRKPAPESMRQSSRSSWAHIFDFLIIFSPNSKRGQKWRFRILCALAIVLAVFLFFLRERIGSSSQSVTPLLDANKDLLAPKRILDR